MQEEIYKNLSLEDLPGEEWRDVVGYEGLYQVSNLGRVRSLDRTIPFGKFTKNVKGKMLSQYLCCGYCEISLGRAKSGKKNRQRVHRLVAEAFIPNLNNYPIINHKNEIKTDNRVENLEWCDYSYNLNYGTRKGWQRRVNGVPVCQYTKEGQFVKKYNSIIEASEMNPPSDPSNIYHCCNKETPSCVGYVWRYDGDDFGVYRNKSISPVKQYDLCGNFIKRYKSMREASKCTGIISSGINNCCLGLSLSSGGFVWKYDDGDYSNIEVYKNPLHKEVDCFSLNGDFIRSYKSIADAASDLGINGSSISMCCKGKLKTTGKHIFKYK